ncbi:MAG TPA: hypothetical protein VGR35_03800 [Tepidisphaeraceae bacterium]|nr:hypothetical protein [Tepidisphaeraceae bacterium]
MIHAKPTPVSIAAVATMTRLSESEVKRLIEVGILGTYQPPRGDLAVEAESLKRFKWYYKPVSNAATECGVSLNDVEAFMHANRLVAFPLDSGQLLVDVRKLQLLMTHSRLVRKKAERKAAKAARHEQLQAAARERASQKRLPARAAAIGVQQKKKKSKKKKRRVAVWTGQTRKRGSHRGPW